MMMMLLRSKWSTTGEEAQSHLNEQAQRYPLTREFRGLEISKLSPFTISSNWAFPKIEGKLNTKGFSKTCTRPIKW